VNAACTSADDVRPDWVSWLTKGAILGMLTRRHVERWCRPQGTAVDLRLFNPYFRAWASAARNALAARGLVTCAQKQ
jgi:hypothetical protein